MDIRRNHPLYLDQKGVDSLCMTLKVHISENESDEPDACDGQIAKEAFYVNKIDAIIDELKMSGKYFTDFGLAAKELKAGIDGVYVDIKKTFHCVDNVLSFATVLDMRERGSQLFETGDISPTGKEQYKSSYDTYNYNDNYYKNSRDRIIMSLDFDKFTPVYGWLNIYPLSFLISKDRQLKLHVIGLMTKIADICFQIEPLAVWW